MNNLQLVSLLTDTMLSYDVKYKLGTYLNIKSNGYLLSDCLGLVEGVLWGYPGEGKYASNGVPDLNCNQLLAASSVSGPISTIPEIPGIIVQKSGNPGHCGIYLGNGQVLEATAHVFPSGEGNGLVISQFTLPNGKNYRNSWENWLKYPFIDYVIEREEEASMASFLLPDYHRMSWLNQTIDVYGQRDDLEIGLLSTPKYKQLQSIKDIDNDEIHYCKVNCSYFVMSGSEKGQVLGREQGFNRDGRPDQTEWLDVVVLKDNRIVAGDLASWEYLKEEVKLGYSPAVILLYEGKTVQMISPAVGYDKYSNKNTQTLHMQDAEGRHYLAVVSGKLNGKQCRDFAIAYGMTFCAMLDSGQSSQMRANGKAIVQTNRMLPNVLTFYKKNEIEKLPVMPEEPTKAPAEGENLMTFEFEVVKGTLDNKTKYPTRATAFGKWDKEHCISVGEEFWIDDLVADGDYWVGHMINGPQAGRWIQLDPVFIKTR